jgi:hypothetical protein
MQLCVFIVGVVPLCNLEVTRNVLFICSCNLEVNHVATCLKLEGGI